MLFEMQNLIKRKGPTGKWVEHADRVLSDGKTVPGNDCSDGGLYSSRHIYHFLARPPEDKPRPGSEQALAAEGEELEKQLDATYSRPRDDGWEEIDDMGGWQ